MSARFRRISGVPSRTGARHAATKQSARSTRVQRLGRAAAFAVEPLEGRLCLSVATFAADSGVATGGHPNSVAVADVNGDGRPDVVTANYASGTVSVLLGRGNGNFASAPGSPVAVGVDPIEVSVADVNGDGRPDLVTVNPFAGNVSVLLGAGDGTFAPAPGSPVAAGDEPTSVAISDVNGDGRPDLVTANSDSDDVSVLLGAGDGTFTPAAGSPVASGDGPHAVTVADFNGDGKPDLLTFNYYSNPSVQLGTGDGMFGPPSPTGIEFRPISAAVADLNGDGRPDLVLLSPNFNGHFVSVFLGAGDGTFAPLGAPLAAGTFPEKVAVADVNGDGRPDLLTTNADSNDVSVLLGAGDGTFVTAAGSPVGAGDNPGALAVADFDSDGRPDVIVANDNGLTLLLNTTPTFAVSDITVTEGTEGISTAAFVVRRQFSSAGSAAVDYFTTNGTATAGVDYQPVSGTLTFGPGQTDRSVVVQVNGDTKPESNETFFLNLDGALNAGFTRRTATATILDGAGLPPPPPPPPASPKFNLGASQTVAEGNAGTKTVTFTVTRTGPTASAATVKYSTGDDSAKKGSDYVEKFGTLAFAAGQASRTLTVQVKGDTAFEPNERFKVVLYDPSAGTAVGTGLSYVNITNDDAAPPAKPKISVGGVSLLEGGSGSTKVYQFKLTLDKAGGSAITVKYATSNGSATAGSDYTAAAGTITFAANETFKYVTVVVKGDATKELDETFFLNLSAPTNATIAVAKGTGTIRNDD